MSSAVCWKWIFSVKKNSRKGLVKPITPSRRCCELTSLVLTVCGGVNDQELLVFQRRHTRCHLGHLHRQGKGTELAGLTAASKVLILDPWLRR